MSSTAPKESFRLKRVLLSRVATTVFCLLLSVTEMTLSVRSARPDVTGPLPIVGVIYPPQQASLIVGGSGIQQVFPVTSPPTTLPFNFDPRNDPTVSFFKGGAGSISQEDFVYALVISNDRSGSSVKLTAVLTSACASAVATPSDINITSVGYRPIPGIPEFHPTDAAFPLGPAFPPTIAGVDFFFENGNSIPLNNSSAVLFYTSPQPPAFALTSIGSTGVVSQGLAATNSTNSMPIYGPCPSQNIIKIVKKSWCINPKNVEVFTDGGTVANGVPIFYTFEVTNNGMTPLKNVKITDKPRVLPNPFIIPIINPGDPPITVRSPKPDPAAGPNGPLSNQALVEADYDIPDQNGNPTGQTVHISAKSNEVNFTVADSGLCGMTVKCDTICFRTPLLCQIFFNKLPAGMIVIGGVGFNKPINIQTNGAAIRNALIPCPISNCTLTPLQELNQQFVASQLSLAAIGGPTSPMGINVLWSNLSCYKTLANFTPVTLSNGVTLTPNSMLKDLFMQATLAIVENRTVDMKPLTNLLKLLNSCSQT